MMNQIENNQKRIESADINGWRDLYAAAPTSFMQDKQMTYQTIADSFVVTCKTIPLRYFNRTLDLGLNTPATDEAIKAILATFQKAGISGFYFHQTPAHEPHNFDKLLINNGLRMVSCWDRIIRDDTPLDAGSFIPTGRDSISSISERFKVEKVTKKTAVEWAQFIDKLYGVPTSEWLLKLVGRKGWHHYICSEKGQIKAVRTLRINPDKTAYLMIDAPVPGIMTQDFEPDFHLVRHMIQDGLKLGVKLFVTDIENPSPTRDTTAYQSFDKLGFKTVYLRKNFAW
jgi:hypothetical protein